MAALPPAAMLAFRARPPWPWAAAAAPVPMRRRFQSPITVPSFRRKRCRERRVVAAIYGNAPGILGQSIGGGGGFGRICGGRLRLGNFAAGLEVGGSGGSGGTGAAVTIDNYNSVSLVGPLSGGIVAQSLGGAGGTGGFAVADGLSSGASATTTIGGGGGSGGTSGAVIITHGSSTTPGLTPSQPAAISLPPSSPSPSAGRWQRRLGYRPGRWPVPERRALASEAAAVPAARAVRRRSMRMGPCSPMA